MLTHGGADTMGPGIATKRRRRREQLEEDDSSDLTDESDEEPEQRDAQRIKFAKMPVRHRAGSSPLQNTALKQPFGSTSPKAVRRGSQSALETVKERPRRDTVTSSEMSSESEFDVPYALRHREAARAAARSLKLHEKINEEPPTPGITRADTTLLPEEEEDSDEGSDISEDYVGTIDSASILNVVENASPTHPVVGTPPRNYRRQSIVRKSQLPPPAPTLQALPPPRPLSTIRPLSVIQPSSLLTEAFKAKQHKASIPFQKFAHYSGKGTPGSIAVRIYPAYSKTASRPFEVPIRPRVSDGGAERPVTVADLIGLSLYRYNEEKREPRLPGDKLNINWWTLRMVEEGGEVDDDFPPFERTKPLVSFTTVHNAGMRGGGRMRANSRAFDDFALVLADEDEFETNKRLTPQEDEKAAAAAAAPPPPAAPSSSTSVAEASRRETTPQPPVSGIAMQLGPSQPRQNPIMTTTYRPNTPLADAPQTPHIMPNTNRGQQKLLRVHIMSSDTVPGQMVTVDVTTDTYLEEVLELVCRKRQLDKANHVLKLPGSGAVVMIDRPVSSIGNVSDLELYRRRFATDGPLTMAGSPSSASPRPGAAASLPESSHMLRRGAHKHHHQQRGGVNGAGAGASGGASMIGGGMHPLAREALRLDDDSHKKYTVWRKQPMRLVLSERLLMIDGEYIHIVPASGGKAVLDSTSKTTTVHFSNVIGCKVPRKHPTNVKVRTTALLSTPLFILYNISFYFPYIYLCVYLLTFIVLACGV